MSPNECFAARTGNQVTRLPRKNEGVGEWKQWRFSFVAFWVKSLLWGFARQALLKIRRPMMRLAAFRILIVSLSRRSGVGGGEKPLTREGKHSTTPPHTSLLKANAKVQPAGTPRYCSLYNALFAKCILLFFMSTSCSYFQLCMLSAVSTAV